jgi:RNA polymerase sigma-70 factor (ECF subfamily)
VTLFHAPAGPTVTLEFVRDVSSFGVIQFVQVSEHAVARRLVRRAQAGDPEAWEALYRRAHPRLFAFARRRLATPDEAEDAVSETLMRAFDHIDQFRWRDGGFEAWLFVICRNIVFEINRRAGRSLVHAMTPVVEPLPEERIVAEEEVIVVRDAFARLTAEEREILELRVVADLGAKQVGRMLGKSAGAVRQAQSRAIAKLRGLMEDTVHAG